MQALAEWDAEIRITNAQITVLNCITFTFEKAGGGERIG
jgi:hypothetical protein